MIHPPIRRPVFSSEFSILPGVSSAAGAGDGAKLSTLPVSSSPTKLYAKTRARCAASSIQSAYSAETQ